MIRKPSAEAPGGREWPEDDSRFMALDPSVYACWPCRKTAKPNMAYVKRTRGARNRDPEDRPFPCCPSCGVPMINMGMKWRPGRGGKWKTGAEVDALAQARAQRRAPVRLGWVKRKPRWVQTASSYRAGGQ